MGMGLGRTQTDGMWCNGDKTLSSYSYLYSEYSALVIHILSYFVQ